MLSRTKMLRKAKANLVVIGSRGINKEAIQKRIAAPAIRMLVSENAEIVPVKKIALEIGDIIPHKKFAVNIAEWPFNFSFIPLLLFRAQKYKLFPQ